MVKRGLMSGYVKFGKLDVAMEHGNKDVSTSRKTTEIALFYDLYRWGFLNSEGLAEGHSSCGAMVIR